jgi:tRNA G46 methylase TrmB
MPNGFKAITVTGTLPYEQFKLMYTFVWVNGFIIEFNVKPDSTAHIKTDTAALAKEITEKTKTFIVKIIQMHKMSEAKYVVTNYSLKHYDQIGDKQDRKSKLFIFIAQNAD